MAKVITTGLVRDKGKWQKAGWTPIDITAKSSEGKARQLAPDWKWIKDFKNGFITWKEYTSLYKQQMRTSQKRNDNLWKNTVKKYNKLVFLCYCSAGPEKECHRFLLAEEFIRFAADEMGIVVDLLPEDGSVPPKETRDIYHKVNGEYRISTVPKLYYAGICSKRIPHKASKELGIIARALEKKFYILRSESSSPFAKGVYHAGNKVFFGAGENTEPNDQPIEFLLCWTPDECNLDETGSAIRIVSNFNIPTYNLKNQEEKDAFYTKYLPELKED